MLVGVICGCLSLNRATFLLLPFVMLLLTILGRHRFAATSKLNLGQWGVVLILFVAVLAPWVMHTYSMFGEFVPHNTRGGWTLLISNGNIDNWMVKEGGYSREAEYDFVDIKPPPDALSLDNMRREMAIRLIKEHLESRPLDYIKIIAKRARNFWSFRPDPYDQNWTSNDWIMLFVWVPIVLITTISPAVRHWREWWPLIIVVLYSFFIVLPFWGTPRFRYSVDPLIVVMAAWSLVYWSRQLSTWLVSNKPS